MTSELIAILPDLKCCIYLCECRKIMWDCRKWGEKTDTERIFVPLLCFYTAVMFLEKGHLDMKHGLDRTQLLLLNTFYMYSLCLCVRVQSQSQKDLEQSHKDPKEAQSTLTLIRYFRKMGMDKRKKERRDFGETSDGCDSTCHKVNLYS